MSTSSLRRQMKNIVHNYSEAEIKVREATSNDPWGPSSSLMSEIADLTYNVVAFSEIMSMIWKRLNDHGKNWRHVYKAMTLMEYLIKTGSERVAQQCKENIYAIQTLKDFQYVDRDGKDQGVNVREKAKQLVSLLKDDERLKEERAHALKTKEKLAQTSTSSSASSTLNPATEAEQAWPQSSGEEELQLQLALAMSKEEAEQPPPVSEEELQLQLALSLSKEEHDKEERIRRGDDLRLQMAIEESKKEAPSKQEESSLMDLADVFSSPAPAAPASDPWGSTAAPSSDPWSGAVNTSTASAVSDPWGGPPVATGASTDPWGAGIQTNNAPTDPWAGTPAVSSADAKPVTDPWNPGGAANTVGAQNSDPWSSSPSMAAKQTTDPWAPAATFSDPWGGSPSKPSTNGTVASTTFDQFISSADEFSDFDILRTTLPHSGSSTGELDLLAGEVPVSRSLGSKSPDAFDMAAMSGSLSESSKPTRKTPESFLGPNAALVDLDSLISKPNLQNTKTSNPFLVTGATSSTTTNPFQPNQQSSLTLNQLRSSPVMSMGQQVTPAGQTPAAIPFSSVSPMVSVSPMAPGIPLANVSPMVGMQPVGGLPVAAVPPGVSPMGLPAMIPPQQLVTQPLVPNLSAQAVTSTTNPFLL
ncbi:epsin-1 isoform X2 [Dendropsophus ebraccatus]|uniref:epsin-1 isoform X2 n=1 Tax=Dendropsophus ebraccatus TaxID=150705 RepID=UPI003831570E